MKLYIAPGSCSLSPHIALREAGLKFEIETVHLGSKKTSANADFKTVNAKGYVPALLLDDGSLLTEGVAIVQYIADQKPESHLAPANGTVDRYRLAEWLNFISTEIHKGMSPLFSPKAPDEWKAIVKETLAKRFDFLSASLEGKQYLMGDTFTVADGYLFTVLGWTKHFAIDLAKWPTLHAYVERVGERPAVKAALAAEQTKN